MIYFNAFLIKLNSGNFGILLKEYQSNELSTQNYISDCLNAKSKGELMQSLISFCGECKYKCSEVLLEKAKANQLLKVLKHHFISN